MSDDTTWEQDWDNDPQVQVYVEHFLKDVLPELDRSAIGISVVPNKRRNRHHKGDVKYWVELGAMIMFDKPIICVIDPDMRDEMPEHLVRVADHIIEADITTPQGQRLLAEKMAVIVTQMEEAGRGSTT
jgi:hypothetical protein